MYREPSTRFSYQTEDYESLWFRLQGELTRRRVWRQDELASLMERLEDESRVPSVIGTDLLIEEYLDE